MTNEELNTIIVKKTIVIGLKMAETLVAMCEINKLADELENLTGYEVNKFKSTTEKEANETINDVDRLIDQFDNTLAPDTRLLYRQAVGALRIRLMYVER